MIKMNEPIVKLKIKDLVVDDGKYYLEVEITNEEATAIQEYWRYFNDPLFLQGKIVNGDNKQI